MELNEKLDKNRWSINKLGIINYWFYDEEEIEFLDGRLILRGENGSGKSVTMQAFIPLLFDGNKSPERLDSFGTKAKKMDDYVLGYNEFTKEENTSYLYMEFKKKETNNYLTIGIGLHGKKGKPIEFYGFIIKDSRRIGKDILLYKTKENKIPLTKLELIKLIGQGGSVVSTQKEYMQLVNENLFGFETIEEYGEFIKLIIDVRQPKLSKDGYKPSDVTKIMSDSLRALTDEDLRPASESIENMNKTKEQLEVLKIGYKALSNILKPYEKYNACVIYNKAFKFVEANKEYNMAMKSKTDSENNINKLEKELIELNEELENIKKQYDSAKAKDEELAKSDIYEKKNQLIAIDENIKNLEKNIYTKEEQLRQKKNIKKQKDEEYERKSNEQYQILKELKDLDTTLLDLATEFQFDEYSFSKEEIFKDINKKYDYTSLKSQLNRYLEKIEKVFEKLKEQKEQERQYDRDVQEVEELNDRKIIQDKTIDKNREYLNAIKEEYIESVYEWENKNKLLKLSDNSKKEVFTKLNSYGEISSFDDVIQAARVDYDIEKYKYQEEVLIKQNLKSTVVEQIEECKLEINDWKTRKEPVPFRQKDIIENRENLEKAGVIFKPFYELIDFKENIIDEEKSKIESALNDMGILDSLVIKKEDLPKALKIDEKFIDKYLVGKPTLFKNDMSQMFKIIGEDTSLNIQVDEILRSIVLDEDDNLIFTLKDGSYNIGILKGKVSTTYNAKFIGTEARKKYKLEMIEKLQKQIEEHLIEKEKIENEISAIQIKIQDLENEFMLFPKKDDIETAYNMLKDSVLTIENIKNEIINKNEKLQISATKLKEVKEQVLEIAKNMYFKLNSETYANVLAVGNDFNKQLLEFQNIQNNIVNINDYTQSIKYSLDEISDDLNVINYDIDTLNEDLNKSRSKKEAIEKLLTSDYTEIEEEISKCKERLEILPIKREEVVKNISIFSTKLDYEKKEHINLEDNIVIKKRIKDILSDVFEKEVLLSYIKTQELADTPVEERDYAFYLQYANKMLNKFNEFESDIKGLDYYLDNLMAIFRDNAGELNEYNITRQELFTNNVTPFENELNIEIRKAASSYIRKDLCGFFKGKSLNLSKLYVQIEDTITQMDKLIEESDRELFEDILTNTIGSKIRRKIYDAKIWIKNINDLLDSIDSKITFSFNWKPKNAETEEQINTKELVDILNSEASLLREEESKKVAKHFRSKINKAEQRLDEKGNVKSLHTLMKEALDYRDWFEFEFYYIKKGEQKKELTNNAFCKLSGGEKAMAMYIPLFAAVYARLEGANKDALRIIALDEAFAGVDEKNIANMFSVLTELKIDYIINSQILWGDYETIPQIAIYHLIKSDATRTVALNKYSWNGKILELLK